MHKPQNVPLLLGTCGFPGLGKSTIARMLVEKGFKHINSDAYRQRLFHKTGVASPEEHTVIFGTMDADTEALLEQGHNVIYDSNMTLVEHRRRLQQIAEKVGAHYRTLYLQGSLELALERNKQREAAIPEEALIEMYTALQPPELWENAFVIDVTKSLTAIRADLETLYISPR